MTKRVSRKVILDWLEDIGFPISKIEDVGKGIVLCQILKQIDNGFPAFRTNPETECDYLYNLSLVKKYFMDNNTNLYLPMEKMCKLKMQDNLEVIQWFYTYWMKTEKTNKSNLEKANKSSLEKTNKSNLEKTNKSNLEKANKSNLEKTNKSNLEKTNGNTKNIDEQLLCNNLKKKGVITVKTIDNRTNTYLNGKNNKISLSKTIGCANTNLGGTKESTNPSMKQKLYVNSVDGSKNRDSSNINNTSYVSKTNIGTNRCKNSNIFDTLYEEATKGSTANNLMNEGVISGIDTLYGETTIGSAANNLMNEGVKPIGEKMVGFDRPSNKEDVNGMVDSKSKSLALNDIESITASDINFLTVNNVKSVTVHDIKSISLKDNFKGNEKKTEYKGTNDYKDVRISEERKYLIETINKLKEVLKILKNERDFYFNKLVHIEKFLDENKSINEFAKDHIFKIMHDTEFIDETKQKNDPFL